MGSPPGWPKRVRTTTVHRVIVWLAVALWLVSVGWSLALMRAAGAPDRPLEGDDAPPEEAQPPPELARVAARAPIVWRRGRRRGLAIGQVVLLALVLVAAALLSDAAQ